MISRYIPIAALAATACVPVLAQSAKQEVSNVMKRLPAYVQLLPNRRPPPAPKPVIGNPPAFLERKARCAHILMAPVDEGIDPGIIQKSPQHGSRMPVYRGLPGCPEDRR